MANSRYRISKELVRIARLVVSLRNNSNRFLRNEKSFLDEQINDGIDEYFDDGDDEIDLSQYMRIRNVYDKDEAETIQHQYEQAMSRDHDYLGNVYGWSLNPTTQIIESVDGDYVVGFRCGNAFILSHFAPRTLSSGMRFMSALSKWRQSVIATVLPKQASMLERLGFKKVGMIPQWFGGETVMKTVMVNEATTESVLSHVLAHGTDKSLIVIYMSTPEMYSADYIADEIKGDDMMQNEFLEIIQNYDDYRSFIPLARIISVMSEISRHMRRTEFFKNCVEAMDKVFSSNFQWKKFKSRYRL